MDSSPQIAYLDGARLRRSLLAACEYAQRQRGELNRINVFPVPDGDTGTNLALTVQAISDHLRRVRSDSVSVVAREAAEAAVLGARGNCGMILSHFLLGFADDVADRSRIGADEFGGALGAGVETLYQALERPVEGTILTVMRETAEAARAAAIPDFVPLVDHLVTRARESLARTPEALPVLRKAGVVDAGAKGFVHLLEGVLLFIHGDPLVAVDGEGEGGGVAAVDYPEPEEQYRFCTEALVRGPDLPTTEAVKARLRDRGDSLIAVRSGDLLKVHIHTDEPEAVFAWLKTLGRLETHKAEDMEAQHAVAGRDADGHVRLARRPVAVVTDSASDLPETVRRAHGIHVTPLLLVTEDSVQRDGVDVTAEEFHRRLAGEDGALPTTSQPAPADFLETYRRAAEDGEEVLGVILGSGLSGTFGSAEAAARRFDAAPVHLVDSRGVTLLQGLLTLKAVEMAERAVPPAEIVRTLGAVRNRSGILFTVDTFDRLLASGRVGRGRAWFGTMLNVKPVLELDREGRVIPAGKALGRSRVLPTLLTLLEARVPRDVRRVRFGITHIDAHDEAEAAREALRERWGDVEILVAPATPVIATHLGTGAWAVAWMVEDE